MKTRSRALLIATAVVIATAAAIMAINPSIATKTTQEAPQTKNYPDLPGTWTYDCEFPVQRPAEIMLTCADGGMIVTDITWKTWTSKQAIGTGIYSQNMCEPSCAEGTREDVPVTIKLGELFDYKGRNVLKTLVIEAIKGRHLPNGNSSLNWDVAEFAVRLNWDSR